MPLHRTEPDDPTRPMELRLTANPITMYGIEIMPAGRTVAILREDGDLATIQDPDSGFTISVSKDELT